MLEHNDSELLYSILTHTKIQQSSLFAFVIDQVSFKIKQSLRHQMIYL